MRRDISRCKYRVGSHPHPSPLPEREREKSGARCYIANITALPQKVNGKAAAFSVSPSDGSYKVNFGEEEFVAYFKDFLRPKLIEMLF